MTHPTESRDALTTALSREYHPMHWDVAYGNRAKPCTACKIHADALIASGAVIDASTLVDDEALREVVTREVIAGRRDYADKAAQRILRALAAALTERSQCLAPNGVECAQHDQNGDRRG